MNPQKIALVTDSCADIDKKSLKKYDIQVIPLRILYGEEEFSDGVSITAKDIYRRQSTEQAKTSLPSGEAIETLFDRLRAEGYQKVVCVHLSSGLSGTYNMVRLLGEACVGMEVCTYDSKSASLGQGVMVLEIAKRIASGMPWTELLRTIPHIIAGTQVVFCLDTLAYLQKGGRIGRISAMAGTMLQIKPLLSFAPTGELTAIAKVRGRKAAIGKMVEIVQSWCPEGRTITLGLVHGDTPTEQRTLRTLLKTQFPDANALYEGELGGTLAVHVGPHLIGIGACVL